MEEKLDSFSIETKNGKKIKINNETFFGKHVASMEEISFEKLLSIITNKKNEKILDKIEVKDDKKKPINFEIQKIENSDQKNIIIISEKKVEFFKTVENNKKIFKKTQEIIKDRTSTIIKEFSDDGIEKIRKNSLYGKKLSEDIIDNTRDSRVYREFYSNGKVKVELSKDNSNRYTLIQYSKTGEQTKKELDYNAGDDFETVKNNNILGKKTKFPLDENYSFEKDFRKLGIVTNINNIGGFRDSFKLPEHINQKIQNKIFEKFNCKDNTELFNKVSMGNIADINNKLKLNEQIKILKESKLKIMELESKEYEIAIENENYRIQKAREFDDKDKLKVSIGEDGKPQLKVNEKLLKEGKYYFTLPNKGSIYVFNEEKSEHHSNFPFDNEKNPNFSVVAAGCFILDKDGKVLKIVNDSGHFKPKSKDCTESFLRYISKEIQLVNAKCSVSELLSDKIKTKDGGYSLSVDITKCEGNILNRKNVTADSVEPAEAVSIISKRRLELIDEKIENKSINLI